MPKILIIENDIFLGDVFMQKLQAGGYEATLSRDGISGLREIRKQHPDLVFLDITLPLLSGFEVLEDKQKDPAIRSIPVIVISDSGQPAEIDRALTLGVKDYLVRAEFNPEEVMAKVRLQLGNAGGKTIAKTAENIRPKPATGALAGLVGKKIMWVEDDKFLSDIIAQKLSTQGCVLFHATEGTEAFKILEREHPDLILLDILLPGIDGFEILKRIKSDEKTKHTPVVLLSNLGQKEDIEKGKMLGAARFLIKATVTLDEIISEIKAVLKEVSSK